MDTTPDEAWDQSWGYADPAQAAAAGRDLVSMYLSRDPSKNVTPAKVVAYHKHGIGVLLNWESQAGAPLQGAAQGARDGADAAAQADALIKAIGYKPLSKLVIAFSCDVDTNPGQYPAIDAYYKAAQGALAGRYLLGVYGEADLVDHLAKAGITDMEWQTYAWSAGRVSSYTDFYQYLNGQTLAGASVDYDRVLHPQSVGAWWPPGHPLNTEEIMAITDADAKKIAAAVRDIGITNPTSKVTRTLGQRVLATQVNTVSGLALLKAKDSESGGIDVQSLADALATELGPDIGKQLVSALGTALAATPPAASPTP